MRQRRAKNFTARYEDVQNEYLISKNEELLQKFLNSNDLYVEIGCGKGDFLNEHAINNRDSNFLGIEVQKTALLIAMEKAKSKDVGNIFFLDELVSDRLLERYEGIFKNNLISGIFLNFSDPWPKKRHIKRRLTSENFLKVYIGMLRSGGFVEFKTDHRELFDFSVESFKTFSHEGSKFILEEVNYDLHGKSKALDDTSDIITTEYEKKFLSRGASIHFLRARLYK